MPELAWRPAKTPERAPLAGETVLLEPLDPERHGDDLFAATANADETRFYLPYGPFDGRDEVIALLRRRAALQDPLALALLDRAAFQAWLAPDNFDASGRQRRSLGEIRAGVHLTE